MNFNSSALVYEILQNEEMLTPAKSAIRIIGSQLHLHSIASDSKLVTFRVNHRAFDELCDCSYLTLRVIKGSLHTLIWSTFARFDDEYVLYYHLGENDLRDNVDNVFLVWSMKGVDAVNSKISMGLIDWFLLRRIQASLKVNSVGVLAFTKMLGRFLISAPNFMQTKRYMPPMPATFMFNYLMMVSYCPFELSVSKLQRFFSQGIDHTSGITNRAMLQAFIQPNGSGAWINGYLPVRLASGAYVLQSKYYFEQGDALIMGSGNATTCAATSASAPTPATVTPGRTATTAAPATAATSWLEGPTTRSRSHSANIASANLLGSLHTVSMDFGDSATDAPEPQPQPHPQYQDQGLASLAFSMQCDMLLQETAVRVVELLHHPFGVRGIIVVLEFVHNRMWTANTRFVALDAYKVCQAIHAAGQMPPMSISKLDILDREGWEQLTTASQRWLYPNPNPTGAGSTSAPASTAPDARQVPSSESRDSLDAGPTDDMDTSDSGEDPFQMGFDVTSTSASASAAQRKSCFAPAAVLSPVAAAPTKGPTKNVNFAAGKPARYNFIDFDNSCEWGAPSIIKKQPDFYPVLIHELQNQS